MNGHCTSERESCALSVGGEGDDYQRLIHINEHPNGGASVVHLYQEELDSLSQRQVQSVAQTFFRYYRINL